MLFEPRFHTLVDILDSALKAHSHRPLFGTRPTTYGSSQWRWTSYAEFGSMVDRFRAGLASLGVTRGDAVAIVANNRIEWAVAAYASYGLGAVYVPMYEAQSPKEWDFIARDCEAKVLIVASDAIVAKADAAKVSLASIPSLTHVVLIDVAGRTSGPNGEAARGGNGAGSGNGNGSGTSLRTVTYESLLATTSKVDAVKPDPSDVAGLIYTSGTTGNPKGVMLTHANIAANVSAIHEVFPMELADRSLSFLPWAHVFGQSCELHALISSGASMAICRGVDKILEDLADVKPTLLFSVPRIFNKIYTAVHQQIASKPKPVQMMVAEALKITAKERAGERLTLPELALLKVVDKVVFEKVRERFGGNLKYAFSGGAALSREVAEFIDSLGVMVFEGYGLTETSPIATANVPGGRKIGSVGRPIPGVRVEIDPATAERKPATSEGGGKPARAEGEIVVYGHNVMKGYLKRPEENAAVFTKDGGFRTGDMGYIDAQGFLFITGRIKEQYKLENGKYVVPTPLEEHIKLSPYVTNVMVYGDNRSFNVALVVANVHAIKAWGEQQHLAPALPADGDALLRDDRVRSLMRREIEANSGEFKGFEGVKDFALIADDFTTENGMLTPSMKLKRRKVVETYGNLIEQLYAKKSDEKSASGSARA